MFGYAGIWVGYGVGAGVGAVVYFGAAGGSSFFSSSETKPSTGIFTRERILS